MLTVIATVIKRKDILYNEAIIGYWGIGYDADIHHWLLILTLAITSVWWISRHIQYLNSQ